MLNIFYFKIHLCRPIDVSSISGHDKIFKIYVLLLSFYQLFPSQIQSNFLVLNFDMDS